VDLNLNGFWLELSSSRLDVRADTIEPDATLGDVRERVGDDWFLHRSGNTVYAIPRNQTAPAFGKATEIPRGDDRFLRILRARLDDVLGDLLPQYDPHSRRPFSIVAQKVEFVSAAARKVRVTHGLLDKFTIRPRIVLEPRILRIGDGEPQLCLIMAVRTSWRIEAQLDDLHAAGVDLTGLVVVRQNPDTELRHVVGRIARLDGDQAMLSESFDDRTLVPIADVRLEGSFESFGRCLQAIFGWNFERLREAYRAEEGAFTTGDAVDGHLDVMADSLRKKSPWSLAPGMECALGQRVQVRNSPAYRSFVQASPVEYCFDAAKAKRDRYAWSGLERHGPFDRDSFPRKTPQILVVAPAAEQGRVEQFCRHFRDGLTRIQNPRYSKGLAGTFGLVNPRFEFCLVPGVTARTSAPGHLYGDAVKTHVESKGADYAAALVILLDEHAKLPDPVSPYLISKATLLMAGVPVQEAKLSTITASPYQLQFTMQNLAVALYAKMGGVPWTVDHDLTVNDEIVIGIGTCEMSGSRFRAKQRHVGITTVFRGDGNYLLASLSKECSYDDYPETLRTSTLQVLREMRDRNGWRDGDTVRLVFHAHRPLRGVHITDIIASCVTEAGAGLNTQFAFLTVSEQHPFRLLDRAFPGTTDKRGVTKAVHVPERGVLVEIDGHSRLLCTNGPSLIKRPALPLPAPLLIRLHSESSYTDLTYLSEQVLKFTSLSWRSVLPAASPVTIYYSELIARLLARFRNLPNWSPDPLIRLRASRWFL
jgi:argonaute-like protein